MLAVRRVAKSRLIIVIEQLEKLAEPHLQALHKCGVLKDSPSHFRVHHLEHAVYQEVPN